MPLEPLWVRASRRNSGVAGQRENRRGRAGFRAAISEDVLPRIRAFAPDLLLISAGFDGADGDDGNAQVRRACSLAACSRFFSRCLFYSLLSLLPHYSLLCFAMLCFASLSYPTLL